MLHNFNGENRSGQGLIALIGGQILSRQETSSHKGGPFLGWNCEEHFHIIILDEVGVMDLNACKLMSKALAKEIVGCWSSCSSHCQIDEGKSVTAQEQCSKAICRERL